MAAAQPDSMAPASHAHGASMGPHARQQLNVYRIVRDLRWAAVKLGQPPTPDGLLRAAGITYTVSSADLEAIPKSGSVLIAVEGAFGVLEGLVLAAVLPQARADIRVLANYILAGIPGLQPAFVAVDPWPGRHAVSVNRQAMAEAVHWLDGQHLLAVFPAGDRMAPPNNHRPRPPWSIIPLRLARMTGAPIVPLALTASTPVEVRIGTPIAWERLAVIGADETATEYIRWHAAALNRRHETPGRLVPRFPK